MKQKKLIVGLAAALVVVIAAVGIIFAVTRPETEAGAKNITVEVVYADETQKEFDINTDAEFLSDALLEEELITQEEYDSGSGMYTVIDGVKADYSVDQSWWCVTKDGEMTSVGMDEQPIADGDNFEITYTIS